MKNTLYLLLALVISIHVNAQITSCKGIWYEGEGTNYGGIAGGAGGHCGIPIASGDIYHCAMNHTQYANSNACGSCVRVLGPKGEVTLKVADECPECKFGDIDLTTGVFPQIAELKDGRVKIKWQYVPCPLADDITLVFAPGMGSYYFKAQIRDAFYPVSKLEYKKQNGSYDSISRVVYNYFVKSDGIDEDKSKTSPYTFRFTSFTGEVIEASNIVFSTSDIVHTGVQFKKLDCPDCAGIMNGDAKIDLCNVCSGGSTNIEPNSSCSTDCAGYWNGTAYLDGCEKCVSGTTGATPCDKDCNKDNGGLAYVDLCGTCVGGNTKLTACKKDCNNDWGGTAFVDSCGRCSGGTTGSEPITNKNTCLLSSSTIKKDKQISISPNPSSSFFNLTLADEFSYTILNTSGIEIQSGKAFNQLTVGSDLTSGVFYLRIESKESILVYRLIKY